MTSISPEEREKQVTKIQSWFRGNLVRTKIQMSFKNKYFNLVDLFMVIRRSYCKETFNHMCWKFRFTRTTLIKILKKFILIKFGVQRSLKIWETRVEEYHNRKNSMKTYFNVVIGMNYLEEALNFLDIKKKLMDGLKEIRHISILYQSCRKIVPIRQVFFTRMKLKYLNRWRNYILSMWKKGRKIMASSLRNYRRRSLLKMKRYFLKWSLCLDGNNSEGSANVQKWKKRTGNISTLFSAILKGSVKRLILFKRITHYIQNRKFIKNINNLDKLLEKLALTIGKHSIICFKKLLLKRRSLRQKEEKITKLIDANRRYILKKKPIFKELTEKLSLF